MYFYNYVTEGSKIYYDVFGTAWVYPKSTTKT